MANTPIDTKPLVAALYSDPNAVVTEAQVRAVAQVYARAVLDARTQGLLDLAARLDEKESANPGRNYLVNGKGIRKHAATTADEATP